MSLVLLNLLLITCVTTKEFFFFSPREAKIEVMFIALWIHLISLKSFVYLNIAVNAGKRCLLLPQRLEN